MLIHIHPQKIFRIHTLEKYHYLVIFAKPIYTLDKYISLQISIKPIIRWESIHSELR